MNVFSKNPSRKRDGQSISIPFIWEEKPGKPKKDWKPSVNPKADDIAAPVKFIASIPFQWEEKPGKPLPCFSQSPVTPLHAPRDSEDEDSSMVDGVGCSGDNTESSNEVSESELDLDGSRNDSFSLAPSLMANGLIPTWEISNAIPFKEIVQYDKHSGDKLRLQCPLSPASQAESSTSSYATGSASLAGNSFLEWLFPLLNPSEKRSFHGKHKSSNYFFMVYLITAFVNAGENIQEQKAPHFSLMAGPQEEGRIWLLHVWSSQALTCFYFASPPLFVL